MTYAAAMADLLALSSHIIDNNDTDIHPNRVINELSEIRDDLAVVESFSHSVVLDTGEGLVAFDTSTGSNG
ncbi:MAG: MBL fold metallo-hydrolase, partial [Actinobacteria bacterium]|nr:MBL fold metallo-hydrolase [Actinomycetota bacterium]